jgi:glycosyltransferase involved in cell wall biosynthesis
MKISIITVTRNSEATVRDTIESVHRQKHVDFEHIIVDGLSTDRTMEIVREYPHITKWVSERDKSHFDAMNKGIALAEGDIVGILNSDDAYVHDRILSYVVQAFMVKGADALYGDLVYVDSDDTRKVLRTWISGEYREGRFLWGWMPPHPSFFVKRELYRDFGGFNLELGTSADYEMMLRLIHRHGVRPAYLPEVLVRMRPGGLSNSSLAARWKANRFDKKSWDVNGVKPYWFTLYLKPIRKIGQYFIRKN